MANNTTLNAGSGGDSITTIDQSQATFPTTGKMPASVIYAGAAANSLAPVNASNPLPVSDGGGSLTVDGPLTDTELRASAVPVSLASVPLPSGAATEVSLAAAAASLAVLDNVVAGNEAQVDVITLPALPAGTNNIGDVDIASIAAGDNNIGNVDIVTMPSITGTVTANAGTNLNTSALALESGGNLASVATSASAINTATGAQADAEATGNGSVIAILKRIRTLLGATLTVAGTVTATVTGATLAAGTALIGAVASALRTDSIMNGTTSLTPKFASIAASSSGDNTVVAAVTSKKIRVLRYSLSANGAVNAKWKSATAGDITGLKYLTQYGAHAGAFCPVGLFETTAGEALVLNLSGAVAVGGELTYVEV